MDDRIIMLVLRLIHIVGGVLWVGAVALMTSFVVPAVRSAGAQGGRVMQELMQRRRLPVYMNVVAGLTMLSGLAMYGQLAAATNGAWAGSRPGMAFGFGGLAAIVAAVIGGVVIGPAGRKLAALGERVQAAGGPPSAEQAAQMQALQARLGRTTRVVALLLLIAAGAMAIARYL
jgi:hypothetical protein